MENPATNERCIVKYISKKKFENILTTFKKIDIYFEYNSKGT